MLSIFQNSRYQVTLYWVGISVNFDQFEPVRGEGGGRREGPEEPLDG